MVKKNAEYKGIQKKLVAAVAMVLVASIMVVTSSYAWFTLSTAPEVTGINTSVGSNGNLEIALRTGALDAIGNSEGATFPAANNSWGNLVDLSNEMYHLEDITLMPAALTARQQSPAVYTFQQNESNQYVNANGGVIGVSDHTKPYAEMTAEDQALLMAQGVQTGYTAPVYNFSDSSWIKVPTYGADGRISDWNTMSYMNPYQNGGFPTTVTEAYGVRGIGTTSGLSQAEIDMLNARKAVSGAKGTALNGATTSLNTDAIKVANIAVKNELGQKIDDTDKTNVANTIKNLQTIVDSLEEAVRASVVALGVSQGKTVDPAAVFNGEGKIDVADIVWQQEANEEEGLEAFDYTAYRTMLEEAYAAVVDMDTKLTNAAGKLENAEVSYDGLVGVLTEIMNPDEIELGGKTVSDHDMNSLVSVFLGGTTPVVTIRSGLYKDIALFVGNYSTPASMYVSGTFAGATLNQNFTVQVQTHVDPPAQGWYLDSAYAWLSGLKVDGSGDAAALMTDLYAYAIDLAFRTNAAGSSLLLQTEAKNRVEGSDATQGAGSYMEFTAGHVSYTIEQMANLMKNIRVLFIDTDAQGTPILAVAGLDVGSDKVAIMDGTGADAKQKYWHVTVTDATNITVDKSQTMTETEFQAAFTAATVAVPADVTAYLAWEQATDMNGNLLYVDGLGNLTTAAEGNEAVYDIPNYTVVDAEAKTIRASLELYNFEFEGVGTIKTTTKMEMQTITALTQNQAKGITAMVYLDGNNVSNADVAIGGNSLNGKLNLQFASDAALDPMDYTFGEKLPTPTAKVEGDTLTITRAEGDTNTNKFKISVGEYSTDITATDGTATFNLSNLPDTVPAGTYKIEIVAAAQGYVDSNKVEVEYTKTAPATP